MRRRPSSRSKSGGIEEGGDADVLYETVIVKHHPTGIFIFLRTHVPLPAGNSRLPARAKGAQKAVVVAKRYQRIRMKMMMIMVGIRMGDFCWLGFCDMSMSGEKVVEYDGGEAQKQSNRETCHLRENPDRPPPPPHTVPAISLHACTTATTR